MNPIDREDFITDDEAFQIMDSLFDEEDVEDESRLEFFDESI